MDSTRNNLKSSEGGQARLLPKQREGGQARLLPKQREGGQAALILMVLMFFLTLAIVSVGVVPALADKRNARTLLTSMQTAMSADSGLEDVTYRIREGLQYNNTETYSINNSTTVVTITDDLVAGTKDINADGEIRDHYRSSMTTLAKGAGASFNYGVQAGEGGFHIKNNASIIGNLYSNGPVIGENDNQIVGSAVSAESNGLLQGLTIQGDAFAHTLSDLTVIGDAYFTYIDPAGIVLIIGESYPGSSDPEMIEMPISDETIEEWKTAATINTIPCSGTYEIEESTIIGPAHFTCDLLVTGDPTVTLFGMVWVEGNLTIQNNANIVIDSSLGTNSLAIIADNPSDPSGSGLVDLKNNPTFAGTGGGASSVFIVSMNTSAAGGGSTNAINLQNNAVGQVILYAPYGLIDIKNNATLRSVTAHTIQMQNNAELIYDEGLASSYFETGPGGSWDISNWHEVQ